MWTEMELPIIGDRIVAFSFPEEDALLVLTESGLHELLLSPVPRLRHLLSSEEFYDSFDIDSAVLTYSGRRQVMHGDTGGEIPIGDHPNGDRLEVNTERELLLITDQDGRPRQSIDDFRISSGWAFAGFSEDDGYLTIGHPHRLRVFRLSEPAPSGASRPRA
jgi:hypothetical protein